MSAQTFFVLLIVLFVLAIYFMPWLISLDTKQPNSKAIFVLNLFLGWTFLGWVIALIWAFKKPNVL